MPNQERRYYVLRAISGKEGKVREAIEAEVRNSDLGNYVFQVVIPTEKVAIRRGSKKVIKDRPYLPGYVLVEAILVGEVMHRLRNIPNVIGFLGDKSPVPLRDSEVDRMLGTADELSERDSVYDVEYIVGDTVKVTAGAFNGFSATVEEVNADKKRLKVMVKIFGRRTPLELDYSQVEKE